VTDPVYEMFWDCPYCNTKELLGLTHRCCPTCGAPQDTKRRYFPPDDKKVAVADHRFVGSDLSCDNCQAANSAASAHCTSCGAVIGDGDKQAQKLADVSVPSTAGTPPTDEAEVILPKAKWRTWMTVLIGVAIVSGLVFAGAAMFWKREKAMTVTGHSWQRSIAIEIYQTTNDSAWCDELPAGARVTSRSQEQRSTRRVADGQSCTTRNVDNGDGTYRQVQDCTPTYREEPVMGERCRYQVESWVRQRDVTAQGRGLTPAPTWPATQVSGCAQLGCTREGARSQSYSLQLQLEGGEVESCSVPQARWQQAADGSRWKVQVGVMLGQVDCSAMTPL
jgi:hypothetical protein